MKIKKPSNRRRFQSFHAQLRDEREVSVAQKLQANRQRAQEYKKSGILTHMRFWVRDVQYGGKAEDSPCGPKPHQVVWESMDVESCTCEKCLVMLDWVFEAELATSEIDVLTGEARVELFDSKEARLKYAAERDNYWESFSERRAQEEADGFFHIDESDEWGV